MDLEPQVTPADRNSKNLLRRAAYWCTVVSWHTPKDAEAAQRDAQELLQLAIREERQAGQGLTDGAP